MNHKSEVAFSKIINYLRRSRKDEEREKRTGEDTLSEQKALMTNVLDGMGIPYTQKQEIGSGDKISTRPVFQEIINELKNGIYDAIAVKEISRLGRGSMSDMGVIYDLVIEHRIYIITPYKIYDPKNESDLRQIRFEMFLSREEFESIRSRMIGAKHTYSMQGKFMGGNSAYGYDVDEQKMILIPNEEKAKIVRLIYELYNNGINGGRPKGIRSISTYLSKMGIKTASGKSTWTIGAVKNILTNPVYKGEIRYRTTQSKNGKKTARPEDEHIIVKEAHEAIIPEELWETTQSKMKSVKKKPSLNENQEEKELTGIVRCAACGYKMTANLYTRHWKKKNGEISTRYVERVRCSNYYTDDCGSLEYRSVEEALVEAMYQFSNIDIEQYRKLYDSIFSESDNNIEVYDVISTNTEKELKALQNRLDFVYEKYESGIYDDNEFIKRRDKLEDEIKKIKSVQSSSLPANNNEDNLKITLKDFSSLLMNAYEIYKSASEDKNFKLCNQILKNVFDDVTVGVIDKGNRAEDTKFNIDVVFNKRYFQNS